MNVHDKVKVNQLSIGWHIGAAASLSGMIGVIAKIREEDKYGNERIYLVTFDKRPTPWFPNETPLKSWWFSRDELTFIGDDDD